MFIDGHLIFDSARLWIDLALSLVLVGVCGYFVFRLLKRRIAIGCWVGAASLSIVAWFFGLNLLFGLSLAGLTSLTAVFFIINQAELRPSVSNALKGAQHKANADKVFDRHELYTKVAVAVEALSKSKRLVSIKVSISTLQ